MALYPLPPSSNESVIDNGRNVCQLALRCRVQDYVNNRLSRLTKRSYSFKGAIKILLRHNLLQPEHVLMPSQFLCMQGRLPGSSAVR